MSKFRVRFVGYYWSGASVKAILDELPAIGDTVKPWTYINPDNQDEFVVAGRRCNHLCPCCESEIGEKETGQTPITEWVLHCLKPSDLSHLRSYYDDPMFKD